MQPAESAQESAAVEIVPLPVVSDSPTVRELELVLVQLRELLDNPQALMARARYLIRQGVLTFWVPISWKAALVIHATAAHVVVALWVGVNSSIS